MKNVSYRCAWPAAGLAVVLLIYVFAVVHLHPQNLFGVTQDDTIYFSSAKAIAAGQGYVMPDLPGSPPAMKYPVLYSWILSWVWRWDPSFPANLPGALGITLAFGIGYVVLAFVFLRELRGLNDLEALFLTMFCALHPTFLFYSSSVVSDLPFSALALAAMYVANRAMRREAHAARAVFCGALAALSMLMRVMGIAIAAGIFCAALVRRAWKQAAILAACMAPVLAWSVWISIAAGRVPKPRGFDAAGPAFQRSWLYYTSYIGFRKLSMASAHLVVTIVVSQATYLLTELPAYFISPLFHRNLGLLFVCTIAVFWMVFAGMIRQAHNTEWQPAHFALLFTLGIIFAWNYPEVQRFLIPFFPLLAASLWLEGKWIAAQLCAALRTRKSMFEKAFAAVMLVVLCAGGLGIAWNFLANADRAALQQTSMERAHLLEEKREAYEWLRRNAPQDARAAAGEDAALYLYTGIQAMSHIALQRAGAYDDAYLQDDLKHMTDVAQAIGAQYWIASSDDSDKQWVAAKPLLAARYKEIEGVLPELFRSSAGHVRIYSLACVQQPDVSACQTADRVLFPTDHETRLR